jgi:hypothetical protein
MYDWLLNQVGMYLAPDDQGGDPAAEPAGGTDKEKAEKVIPDPLREFLAKRNLDIEKDDPLKIMQVLWSESGKTIESAVGREKAERQKRQESEGKLSNIDLDTLLGDEKVSPTLKSQILDLARQAEKTSALTQTIDVLVEFGEIPSELLDVIKEGPAATRAAIAFTKRQEAGKGLTAN